MKIHNTGEAQIKPSVVMLVYGQGGIGKTTFCSTAPTPIIADCENGAKYFGLRGIKVDVSNIETWKDIEELYQFVKTNPKYETVVIDPIGELMEKLKTQIINSKEKKFVQYDGSITMAGWGEMKDRMRRMLKAFRDLNKHVIIVAHVSEKDDEGKMIKRPKVETKLSEELVALVDVAGFMELIKTQGANGEFVEKRIIRVAPSDKYESKDRTGQLGGIIEPDFTKIINACQGNEVYSWSSAQAKAVEPEAPVTPAEAPQKPTKSVFEVSKERIQAINVESELKTVLTKIPALKVTDEEKKTLTEMVEAKLMELTPKAE